MRAKNIILLIPIVLVLVVSGCTNIAPTTDFGGLQVTFSSDQQQAAPNSHIRLNLAVQNLADGEIKNIKANVLGATRLQPYSLKQLLKGQKESFTWGEENDLKAHQDEIPMSFLLRLTYEYFAVSVTTVPIISEQEGRRLRDQGKAYPILNQKSISGPVTIGFESLNPVVVYDIGTEFPVRITLQNVGGGEVCSQLCTDVPDKTVKLKIKYDSSKLTLLDCDSTEEIELIDKNTINCRFKTGFIDAPDVSADITVETDVEYWVEKTASVQVKKPGI